MEDLQIPCPTAGKNPTLGFLREVHNRTDAVLRLELNFSSGWATLSPSLQPGEQWPAALWIPRAASMRAVDASTGAEFQRFDHIGDYKILEISSDSASTKRKRDSAFSTQDNA